MLKRRTSKTIGLTVCVLLALAAIFCCGMLGVNAEEVTPVSEPAVIASGICGAEGDNLTWVLTDDGTLTISGIGSTGDYTGGATPEWDTYTEQIVSVVVEEGVTDIGQNVFVHKNLTSITLPSSLTSVSPVSIYGCIALKKVIFGQR